MNLTYAQFKQKIAETKARIVAAFHAKEGPKQPGKLSQTALKAQQRRWRTRPRAACDSFRYQQKHQHELRAMARVEQDKRRNNRLSPASSSLRKQA